MRYQSIAIALSATVLLSACSDSKRNTTDPVPELDSTINSSSALFNDTSNSVEQPPANDDPVATDNESDATTTGASNESTTADILNSDNADAVILQAFEVYSGRAYDRRMSDFPYVERRAVQFQEPAFNEFSDTVVYRSLSCSNEGDVNETASDPYQPLLVNSLYNNCTIGSDQLNGRVVLSAGDNGGFQRQFSDLFTLNFPGNGTMEVSGNYQYRTSRLYIRELVVNDLDYHLTYDGGTLSVRNANTQRKYRLDGVIDDSGVISMMEGSFNMTPPVLNGASVSVATTAAFENDEKPSQLSYDRGRLQIIANDSEIIVDANTGDPDTVEVSVIGSTGPASTRTVNWQRWHDALAFEPPGLSEDSERALPQLGSGTAVITQDSYTAILKSAFNIYNGETIGPAMLQMPGYPMPEFPVGIGTTSFPDGFADPVLETCDNGGSAVLTPYKWGARQITTGWNSEFSDCERNGVLYDGIFKTRDFGNFSYRSPGISIVDGNGSRQLSANLAYKYTSNRDGSPTVHVGFGGSYADNTEGENNVEVTAASTLYSGIYQYLQSISGRFHLKNAATGQNWVAVSIPDPLITTDNGFWTNPEQADYPITGLMIIEAGNGNSLWLRPDNGDIQTFEIFIYTSGARPMQVTEAWSDWLPYVQFNADLHNR